MTQVGCDSPLRSLCKHVLSKVRNISLTSESGREKRSHIQCFVRFWYSDWGVISRASWSVLWNIASSNKHYHHASQDRDLLIVSLSHYVSEWLCTMATRSSHDKDRCHSFLSSISLPQGLSVSCVCVCSCLYVCRCIPVWSLPYVLLVRGLKRKGRSQLCKSC